MIYINHNKYKRLDLRVIHRKQQLLSAHFGATPNRCSSSSLRRGWHWSCLSTLTLIFCPLLLRGCMAECDLILVMAAEAFLLILHCPFSLMMLCLISFRVTILASDPFFSFLKAGSFLSR